MLVVTTVTGMMLITQNLHRRMNKVIFTHGIANKKLMQDSTDEFELS